MLRPNEKRRLLSNLTGIFLEVVMSGVIFIDHNPCGHAHAMSDRAREGGPTAAINQANSPTHCPPSRPHPDQRTAGSRADKSSTSAAWSVRVRLR